MKKIKSFFAGIILLIIAFVMAFLVALLYRASERISVKTFIFQNNSFANQRVGALQNLDDMSAVNLRNKLIKKYVSEYFRVIPGETDVEYRPVLRDMSSPTAYSQWQSGEAKKIIEMSAKKMFRKVYVSDTDIVAMNMPEGYDYYNATTAAHIFYSVNYYTETWTESNSMATEPIYENGVLYIEVRFKPGLDKSKDVRKYLESGKSPVGLFMFKVTNIGDKTAL